MRIARQGENAQRQEQAAKIQAQRQADAETHAREVQKLRDAKDLAIFEARLKAATAVEVAQISAKGSLVETAIQAESDANVALSKEINPDGDTTTPEIISPITKLTQMHAQGQEMHAQSIDKLGSILTELTRVTAALAEHAAKPKTVHAKSSSGASIMATIQ